MSDAPFATDEEIQAYVDGVGDPRKRTPLPPFAPSVFEKNPGAFKQSATNPAPRPQPWSRGVEETISPTLNAYGMGQMAAEGVLAAREGDYGTAAADAVMVGLPGARRLARAPGPARLHRDDPGGAARMRFAAQEVAAGRMAPDEAWQHHGTIAMRGPRGAVVPFASVPEVGKGWNGGVGRAPLGAMFDGERTFAAAPELRNADAAIALKPELGTGGVTGWFQAAETPRMSISAGSADGVRTALDHELTHGIAASNGMRGWMGSSPDAQPPALPWGATTELDAKLARNVQSAVERGLGVDEVLARDALRSEQARRALYLADPGERLARLEQLMEAERRAGRDPRARPLSDFDEWNMGAVGGPDLRSYRLQEK